ncbi:MAG: CsbD family protein [Actinomycetota bacterium]
MGFDDKMDAKKDKLVGKGKEEIGDLTDNESLEAEGKADQAKGGLKDGWEKVKDGAGDAKEAAKDATR